MTQGISFIVPTYNEEQYIGQCLTSIMLHIERSNIPTELIIVDNNSEDNTAAIAKKFTSLVLHNPNKGCPAISRNIGASHAQYEILCFIDGDCLISDDWIARLISAFTNPDIGAYGGPILSPTNGNWVETSWAPTESASFIKKNGILAGANFSIRKNIFDSLKGFDESLISAEDDDLSKRVITSGFTISYDSNQSVIHLGYPKSLMGIFKKQIWHGSSQIRAHGLWGDKVVMLTILHLINTLYFLLALVFFNIFSMIFSTVMLLSIPLVLVYGRSRKFLHKNYGLYLKMYLISITFLWGRTVGLMKEIGVTLKKVRKIE